MKNFFEPLKEKVGWKVGVLNLISSFAIFYAPYAPSIWAALGALLLSYIFVYGVYLTFCYIKNQNQ